MGNIIFQLLAPLSWPSSGLWEAIIKLFEGVGNFGLAIIIFTICLKIVMLPLDFWQRAVTRKTSTQQALIAPEVQKIKEKYGKNTELVNQKTAELYKKNGVSPMGSCSGLIVNMIISMVVFITLFNALGNISRTKINYEYYQLKEEYAIVYKDNLTAIDFDREKFGTIEEYAQDVAQKAVTKKYGEIKESFLWISNIWRADSWVSVFPNADEFITSTGVQFIAIEDENSPLKNYIVLSTEKEEKYTNLNGDTYLVTDFESKDKAIESATAAFKENYEIVTKNINATYSGWNGYLILVVLSGVVTFLSQKLSTVGTKSKDKKGNEISGAKPNALTGIILSAFMVIITIGYSSAFALYIVFNSILSLGVSILINVILNKLEIKKETKKIEISKADYSRK